MPTLVLTAVVDGTVTNPVPVEQNFYNPSATGTGSAEIINGHLDNNNREAGWDINREHIQKNALSGGGAVGTNANLDYFGDTFFGWDNAADVGGGAAQVEARAMYKPIPGGSIQYALPYNCSIVILSWSIFASSMPDISVPTGGSNRPTQEATFPEDVGAKVRLFLDGAEATGTASRLFIVPTMANKTPGGIDGTARQRGDLAGTFDRWWAGHVVLTSPSLIDRGWHSASLRIASTSQNSTTTRIPGCQTRVRCRHMDYVYFL